MSKYSKTRVVGICICTSLFSYFPINADTGEPSVGKLIERLQSNSLETRRQAASVLAYGSLPDGHLAVPALTKALTDSDERVRSGAAASLGNLGPKAESAADGLTRACHDPSLSVAKSATSALGRIGSQGVRGLVEALKDERTEVRETAANALGEVGMEATSAIPALSMAANDADRGVHDAAIETLSKLGPDGLQALALLLSSENQSAREESARLLANAEEAATPFAGIIAKAYFTMCPEETHHACRALTHTGEAGLTPLLEAFTKGDEKKRQRAIGCIIQFGTAASSAVPLLIPILVDEKQSEELRSACAKCLGAVGRDQRQAIDVLIGLLDQENSMFRYSVIAGLEAAGPAAIDALPKLIAIMQEEGKDRFSNRNAAIRAIGAMGPDAVQAVPALRIALTSEDRWERENAIGVIAKIGPSAKEAVPELLEVLNGKDIEHQRSAAFTLGILFALPDEKAPEIPEKYRDAFDRGRRSGRERLHASTQANSTRNDTTPKQNVKSSNEGNSIVGDVFGPKPFKGAVVSLSPRTYDKKSIPFVTTTDDLGTFRFEGIPAGDYSLIAVVEGCEPVMHGVMLPSKLDRYRMEVKETPPTTFKVADAEGKPLKDVDLTIDSYRSGPISPVKLTTDASGSFSFPVGMGFVSGHATKEGLMVHRFSLSASVKEFSNITMRPPFRIRGQVTDAETGGKINSFEVRLGFFLDKDNVFFDEENSGEPTTYSNGEFEITVRESATQLPGFDKHIIAVDAPGYVRSLSRPYTHTEGDISLEINLKKENSPTK